jgi:rhamnulokinase
MPVFAAVDLGAQSGRVALGRFDGERLSIEELHRFPNEPVLAGGRLQWDTRRLFRDTLDGLAAAARAADVDAVAVDSWAVDFGLVGADGRLLANPVHYRDRRRAAAFDSVLTRIPARELYTRTGIQLLPINTIFELAAMAAEGDPALAAADSLLLVPDLFNSWLCGSRVAELTNATTTQCYDPSQRAWADDLLARLEVPSSIFPEIVPPGTLLGPVVEDVAAETGLGAAPVIAGATHDTASAVVAVPFREPASVFLSVGTWSLVGLETREPLLDERAFDANVTNEGGVAGTFRLLRNVTGLWLLHECRRAWAAQGADHSFDELVALAAEAPPLRALLDPNDPVFAEPGDMPARIAESCARTNQPVPEDPGATARCILESLALAHAETVEAVSAVAGTTPREVHVVGGGARNELLCRWTAEAAELPVLAGPEEATLVGNVLVQAMALGELATLAEARAVVRASFAVKTYEPEGGGEWREARERFRRLAPARVEAEVGA